MFQENLIAIVKVPALLPPLRGDKRVHPATIYNWATRGCFGVKLETVAICDTLYTTEKWLLRFIRDTAKARGFKPPPLAKPRRRLAAGGRS